MIKANTSFKLSCGSTFTGICEFIQHKEDSPYEEESRIIEELNIDSNGFISVDCPEYQKPLMINIINIEFYNQSS